MNLLTIVSAAIFRSERSQRIYKSLKAFLKHSVLVIKRGRGRFVHF